MGTLLEVPLKAQSRRERGPPVLGSSGSDGWMALGLGLVGLFCCCSCFWLGVREAE